MTKNALAVENLTKIYLDSKTTKENKALSNSKAENFIRSKGARPAFKGYMGFPATLCVSVDDEVVHGIPNNIPRIESVN